jgi:hypothetical protein
VRVGRSDGTFVLEVRNDGARRDGVSHGSRMGLRLAAVEAVERSGVVEFGPADLGEWRVRLVVPLPEDDR